MVVVMMESGKMVLDGLLLELLHDGRQHFRSELRIWNAQRLTWLASSSLGRTGALALVSLALLLEQFPEPVTGCCWPLLLPAVEAEVDGGFGVVLVLETVVAPGFVVLPSACEESKLTIIIAESPVLSLSCFNESSRACAIGRHRQGWCSRCWRLLWQLDF